MDERKGFIVGKGKAKRIWIPNATSNYTMPVKIYELEREDVFGIWGFKKKRLLVIQTADSKAREIQDHIVITLSQAKQIIKRLEKLRGRDTG